MRNPDVKFYGVVTKKMKFKDRKGEMINGYEVLWDDGERERWPYNFLFDACVKDRDNHFASPLLNNRLIQLLAGTGGAPIPGFASNRHPGRNAPSMMGQGADLTTACRLVKNLCSAPPLPRVFLSGYCANGVSNSTCPSPGSLFFQAPKTGPMPIGKLQLFQSTAVLT